jgi:hypothetical protein
MSGIGIPTVFELILPFSTFSDVLSFYPCYKLFQSYLRSVLHWGLIVRGPLNRPQISTLSYLDQQSSKPRWHSNKLEHFQVYQGSLKIVCRLGLLSCLLFSWLNRVFDEGLSIKRGKVNCVPNFHKRSTFNREKFKLQIYNPCTIKHEQSDRSPNFNSRRRTMFVPQHLFLSGCSELVLNTNWSFSRFCALVVHTLKLVFRNEILLPFFRRLSSFAFDYYIILEFKEFSQYFVCTMTVTFGGVLNISKNKNK